MARRDAWRLREPGKDSRLTLRGMVPRYLSANSGLRKCSLDKRMVHVQSANLLPRDTVKAGKGAGGIVGSNERGGNQ
jgi:hypothetical protein